MTYKAALDADARIAAKNALKIMAALRQTFDAKAVYERYLTTQPAKSDNPAQDRARARSWAILNVTPNMQAMNTVMQRVLAEGYVTGELFADEQLRIARELKKADDTYVDWANWKPGDRAAALLLRPPKAFQQLLESQGIALKEMSQTTVRDIGNAIADAVDLGLSADRSAKNIMRHVANPARALSIAITEQNRAISYATVNRYKEAGLEQMEWEVSSPCDKCAKNANAVVPIGAPFPTGATQPPQHPHCRCVLLPVIPDFGEEPALPGGTITPMPAGAAHLGDTPVSSPAPTPPVPVRGNFVPGEWHKKTGDEIFQDYMDQIKERYGHNPKLMQLAMQNPDREMLAMAKNGSLYKNGNIEVQFFRGGASVSEKTKKEFLELVDKLQVTNGKDKLTIIIGTSKKDAYGWAIAGGEQIWIAPSTIKMAAVRPSEYLSKHKMPVLEQLKQWQYTLAHEWGHHIDVKDVYSPQGLEQMMMIKRLRTEFPDAFVSKYATTNDREFYAEMFAEWFGSGGTTDNQLVQAMAKELQWSI